MLNRVSTFESTFSIFACWADLFLHWLQYSDSGLVFNQNELIQYLLKLSDLNRMNQVIQGLLQHLKQSLKEVQI